VYIDPQVVADLWADYYEKLATPSKDKQFDEMNEKVMEILQCSEFKHDYIFSTPITTEEINTTVKSLPNGKAPGIDGIRYEHIKYRGNNNNNNNNNGLFEAYLQSSSTSCIDV
jgi:selenocysteine lyase/cysteine desulfurase